MRYTKELQNQVKEDLDNGLSLKKCAEKYNLPLNVIQRWGEISTTDQEAKVIAIRKYQNEVSDLEAQLENYLSPKLNQNLSDKKYFEICDKIEKSLYELAIQIIKKERDLNPKEDIEDDNNDSSVLIDLTTKWSNNAYIKKYSKL